MSKSLPKSKMFLTITAQDKNGNIHGHFEATSGNIYYYRKHAKSLTYSLTWLQLMQLFEEQLEAEETPETTEG